MVLPLQLGAGLGFGPMTHCKGGMGAVSHVDVIPDSLSIDILEMMSL
jgi:hypothetical protein